MWLAAALILLAGLMVVNLIGVSCVLMVLWWVLQLAFVIAPAWLRSRVA